MKALQEIPKASIHRLLRFGVVGATCFLFQVAIMASSSYALHVSPTIANALGFIVSAQLNFVLSSRVTWKDRVSSVRQQIVKRWLLFNTSIVVSFVVNTVVFHVLFTAAGMMSVFASFIGVLSGMVVSFTMSNVLTFRKSKPTTEIRPTAGQLDAVKLFVQGQNGIAVFLPAYKEAGNLPKVTEEATAYLQGMGCSYKVIIVNDGSPDNTGTVAEKLADAHTNVEVVHHEHNLGYGGALKTGFRHAIEKTSHGLIAFWDSDGQFKPESLGALLHSMATEEADLSIGYRIKRADSLKRLIMGRGWHWLSSHILGYKAIDVDCGFKAFRANTIRSLLGELTGENAAISPELIARAQRKGYIMTQVGVNHYPRDEGEQTGANLGVVFHSLKQLFSLRRALKNTPEGVTTDVNNNVAIAK